MTALQEICEQPLTPEQFGPDYAEKCRRMEPGGRLHCFNNVLQDGDSVGVAEVVHNRCHPAPNARPCRRQPPGFAVSNLATEEEENDPGWSTSETPGSQYNT